jgi:hypothetical protein
MKLSMGILFILSVLDLVFSRKHLIVPKCYRILDPYVCQEQNHCRWSGTLDECISRVHLYRRGVMVHRPLAVGGFIGGPRVAAHGPQTFSVSRPSLSMTTKSAPPKAPLNPTESPAVPNQQYLAPKQLPTTPNQVPTQVPATPNQSLVSKPAPLLHSPQVRASLSNTNGPTRHNGRH